MIVRTACYFLGVEKSNFKGKNGEPVEFQRVHFMPVDSDSPMSLTALNDLDFSTIDKMAYLSLEIDFWNDNKSGFLKGKIVGVE